ncbi:MAG: hypothetical protein IR153_03895 [Flavobacterium sp.]|nr:hypothetical protein [Flavobacterium sp.]
MDLKVEYIARLFQKTSYKAIENYCLTRLWHRLNNDEIKLVPQQYVNRHSDRYALTDVYLPQFKIHIEVNEPAHYDSPERILQDQLRKFEIEQKTGHRLFVIDCRKNIQEVHKEIEVIVDTIKKEVLLQKQEGKFSPWRPDIERNVEYWRQRIEIHASDEISFKSVEDICSLFNADFTKTKRGFLRQGAVQYPRNDNYIIWWPARNNKSGWLNNFEDDSEEILVESHIDLVKRANHYNNLVNTREHRIVFYNDKDMLGFSGYKFKGLYEIDRKNSSSSVGLVWKRVDTKFKII